MSFLSRAGIAATRSTRVVQKRFGSHAAHSGPEAPPTQEGFTSSGFKLALVGIIGLIAWSRIDEHLTKQGEVTIISSATQQFAGPEPLDITQPTLEAGILDFMEKHPLTRYIEYYMRSEEESNRINEQHIKQAQQKADDLKFAAGAALPPKVQLRYPDLMNSASGRLIEVGSAVDTEGVVPKFH
ncbi:hypothetical protein BGZ98_001948 [Dissophora globulifera]|nr:hypothetical protein BGZ98_001948 [Dissophora globulifera]